MISLVLLPLPSLAQDHAHAHSINAASSRSRWHWMGFHLSQGKLKQSHPHGCRMMLGYRAINMVRALVDAYEEMKRAVGIVKSILIICAKDGRQSSLFTLKFALTIQANIILVRSFCCVLEVL